MKKYQKPIAEPVEISINETLLEGEFTTSIIDDPFADDDEE